MRIEAIRQRLRAQGALAGHEHRVLRHWAMALPHESGRRKPADFLPKRVRAALPALADELAALAQLRAEHASPDGSVKLLVALNDGQMVESVLLPGGGLCVSTQVGCAVGCVFCMTGRGGLARQLGSAEIVAQVALARTLRPVRKVVFMGMGEPAHNLDNVIEAIELLGSAGGIGHKQLVFSSVGDRRVFEALPRASVRPALALSLHSTDAARRAALLPNAPRLAPDELVELGEGYARATRHPIQYQWTLLDGINDGADEIDGLVALLHGKLAMLNLIPYNRVDGLPFARPSAERAEAMALALRRRGVRTTLRQSAGQDVDAGCGQLRARTAPLEQPITMARRQQPELQQ
ncbi:MAG TPA: RNA methyltransferase [Burkholderiaceae bacterium]|nr:RNA methyltransferase [Burkholderiaceae bacterium]